MAKTSSAIDGVQWQSVSQELPSKTAAKAVFNLFNQIVANFNSYAGVRDIAYTSRNQPHGGYHIYRRLASKNPTIGTADIRFSTLGDTIDYIHSKKWLTYAIHSTRSVSVNSTFTSLKNQINAYSGQLLFRSCTNCHTRGDDSGFYAKAYSGAVYMGECGTFKENDNTNFFFTLTTQSDTSSDTAQNCNICLGSGTGSNAETVILKY